VLFPASNYKHVGLTPGQGGYYWFRVISTYKNPSPWYPLSATAGLYASASADPTSLMTILTGSLGLAQLSADLAKPITSLIDDVSQIVSAPSEITNILLANEQAAATQIKALIDQELRFIQLNGTVVPLIASNKIVTDAAIVDSANATLTAAYSANSLAQIETAIVLQKASATAASSLEIAAATQIAALIAQETSFQQINGNIVPSIALIKTTQSTQETINTAAALSVSNLVAQVNDVTTGLPATLSYLNATNAAQATINTATSTSLNTLHAQVNDPTTGLPATLAIVNAFQSAQSTENTAMTSSINTLSAQVNNPTTGLPNAYAVMSANAQTAATETTAVASNLTTLSSQVNNSTTGLPATLALVNSNQITQAGINSAVSVELSTLSSTVASNSALITSNATAAASATNAIATSVTNLQAQVTSDDTTLAAVQVSANALSSTVSGLSAAYTIKVQANGTYAAMQLGSNTTTGSSVIFACDKFEITKADGTGATPIFLVGTVNGVSAVGINGQLIVDGSVTARQINATDLHITGHGSASFGDFTEYAWPAAGGTGAYIGPNGLLLGNYNPSDGNPNGYYYQINAPVGGTPSINTNIPSFIGTLQIQNSSITAITTQSSGETLNLAVGDNFIFNSPFIYFSGFGGVLININISIYIAEGGLVSQLYRDGVLINSKMLGYCPVGVIGVSASIIYVDHVSSGNHQYSLHFISSGSGATRIEYYAFTCTESKR
jgi:hypothetical protein